MRLAVDPIREQAGAMSPGPEFVDDDGPNRPVAEPDDVLGTAPIEPGWYARALGPWRRGRGSRRRLGSARAGVVLLAAGVVVAAAAAVVPQDSVVRGRGVALPGPVVAEASAPSAPAVVRGVAGSSGPLTDYVRQTAAAGACPTVPIGSSPTRSITGEVQAALPELRVTDVARTLDEFTGLCSVRLRARGRHGEVLALVVSAPPAVVPAPDLPFAPLQVGTDTAADGTSTVWVSATTVRHWSVVIGAVGTPDALPSSATLQRLALQDGLTW